MPMGFLGRTSIRRVDLGDGFWVDVRELTTREFGQVERHLSRTEVKGDDVHIDADLTGFRQALVVAAICDWNLTDENDGLLPLEPAAAKAGAVGRLPVWAFTAIHKVADSMNGARPDEVQFRDPSAGGAADGDGGAAGVAAVPDVAADVAEAGPAGGRPLADVLA